MEPLEKLRRMVFMATFRKHMEAECYKKGACDKTIWATEPFSLTLLSHHPGSKRLQQRQTRRFVIMSANRKDKEEKKKQQMRKQL